MLKKLVDSPTDISVCEVGEKGWIGREVLFARFEYGEVQPKEVIDPEMKRLQAGSQLSSEAKKAFAKHNENLKKYGHYHAEAKLLLNCVIEYLNVEEGEQPEVDKSAIAEYRFCFDGHEGGFVHAMPTSRTCKALGYLSPEESRPLSLATYTISNTVGEKILTLQARTDDVPGIKERIENALEQAIAKLSLEASPLRNALPGLDLEVGSQKSKVYPS